MSAAPKSSTRLVSLDGLRGVAAVTVVLWHSVLLVLSVHGQHGTLAVGLPVGTAEWWITGTPLRILIAGPQAVLIFFVLSGIVVTLPTLRDTAWSWRGYYVRRLTRLYIPVIVAVLLACVEIASVHRGNTYPRTWLVDSNASTLSASHIVREALLLTRTPKIVNPLWSLFWELLFSLLLPFYTIVARRTQRHWGAAVIGLTILSCLGSAVSASKNVGLVSDMAGAVNYLSIFAIGSVIAGNLASVRSLLARVSACSRHVLWYSLAVAVALACLVGGGIIGGIPGMRTSLVDSLNNFWVFGAVLLVLTAMGAVGFGRVLESEVVQWLGKISFGLYLVHVPLIVTTYWLLRGNPWLTDIAGILASFVVAEVFRRLVDEPSHRLARRFGGIATRLSYQSA